MDRQLYPATWGLVAIVGMSLVGGNAMPASVYFDEWGHDFVVEWGWPRVVTRQEGFLERGEVLGILAVSPSNARHRREVSFYALAQNLLESLLILLATAFTSQYLGHHARWRRFSLGVLFVGMIWIAVILGLDRGPAWHYRADPRWMWYRLFGFDPGMKVVLLDAFGAAATLGVGCLCFATCVGIRNLCRQVVRWIWKEAGSTAHSPVT